MGFDTQYNVKFPWFFAMLGSYGSKICDISRGQRYKFNAFSMEPLYLPVNSSYASLVNRVYFHSVSFPCNCFSVTAKSRRHDFLRLN